MTVLKGGLLATASTMTVLLGCAGVWAAEGCSTYPTGTAEKIESSALESLGAVSEAH